MENRGNLFSHIRLVYQRSRTLTKVVVLVALVLSMAALVTLAVARQDAEDQAAKLREQVLQLEQKNAQLEQYIDDLGSVQSVERIAAEELGLVDPDTVIIQPQK